MKTGLRRILFTSLSGLILLATLASMPPAAQAARGVPGSPEFGIGARLDLQSPGIEDALSALQTLHLDWVAVQFSWEKFSPQPDSPPDYALLDRVMDAAQASGTAILLSLSHPPAWAITPTGPDPLAVVNLLAKLLEHYPGRFQAIELFPAPNTRSGWGAAPDPEAYLNLYRAAVETLSASDAAPFLVAGGIEILAAPGSNDDLDDLKFLNELLVRAPDMIFPVVGLRYSGVQGSPFSPENGSYATVLRHYEEIRRMLKSAGQTSSLLWITYLGVPDLLTRAAQTAWLQEAYTQVRSQLYIGAAFLQGLNTCQTDTSCAEVALLEKDGTLHPFAAVLRSLLDVESGTDEITPGRAKSSVLFKPR